MRLRGGRDQPGGELRRPGARLTRPGGGRDGRWLLAALVLVSLNLRPAVASVPPVLRTIQHDLGLSGAAAGLLAALPVVCMGLFAPLAAVLADRWGAERTVAVSLAALGAGTAARGAGGGAGVLFAATLLAGVGVAAAGALLPGLVKAHFPERGGTVTGLYTMGLAAGAMVAAGLTVPLSDALGGSWRRALAAWALLAVAALAAWAPVARARPPGPRRQAGGGWPWRSPLAWRVTLYTGLQSLLFYATLTWLSPLYQAHGWSAERAGLLLALFSLVQLGSALGLPALADRSGTRRPWIALAVGSCSAGLLAIALAPTAAPWLEAAVTGFGMGGQFALALTLLVDTTADPAASRRLSGMAFLVGYLLAAAGPPAVGGLRDLTGGFTVPFLALVGVGLAALSLGVSVRHGATV